jgi:peptidoglycan/xylan/chitin deacetylase (PgdA/CDA1 family)
VSRSITGAGGAVPVLMLHSVAPSDALAPHRWLQRLATSPELIEATFDAWRRRGMRTLRVDELRSFLTGQAPPPDRAVVLTLDDGYVDNWVALTPLLQAYGFNAVVFVSTDFVDPRPIVRPRREPDGRDQTFAWRGYLSWDEMRAAEATGALEIQSHAKTHTWYFTSDKVVDYYRPGNALTGPRSRLRFLWLNAHEDRKPFALEEMGDASVAWGTPVYEFAPALVARRYFPDPREGHHLVEFVANNGGAALFDVPDWRERLDAELGRLRSGSRPAGAFETDDERTVRLRFELSESRRLLSGRLGHPVDFLSFPQGGMDDAAERLALEEGYSLWTMPSRAGSRAARVADGPHRVYRCGGGYGLFGDARGTRTSLLSQRLVLARHLGNPLASAVTRAVGLVRRVSERIGGAR